MIVRARPNGAVPESGARRNKNRLLSAGIEFPQTPVSNRALPRLAAQSADYRYTVQIELIDTGGTARLGCSGFAAKPLLIYVAAFS